MSKIKVSVDKEGKTILEFDEPVDRLELDDDSLEELINALSRAEMLKIFKETEANE